MEKQGFKTTALYFKNAGTIWFILGILLSIIGNFELTNYLFKKSDVLWYGKLQPIIIQVLIFGAILSYFFGAVFQELDQINVDVIKPTIVGNTAFGIYQFSLIFGLITLMYGYNQGRSYGELNFIADNLFMLVFTIIVVLTLIYAKKSEKLLGSFQFIIVTLAGMMVTYFLGNFGFPNSYITTVPPTSGFQDAMVQGFYKTSIMVFFISLPLLFILYSTMKNLYKIADEEQNFILPLMLITILTAFSAGVGLEKSAFSNFWTILGDYIYSAISILLLGIAYILHNIYKEHKQQKPMILLSVSGALLSIFFFYNFVVNLPIIHQYFQYTLADSLVLFNKLIYMILPIALVYNIISNNSQKNLSNAVSLIILILGSVVFIVFVIEGIMNALAIYGMNNNELAIKQWSQVVSKNMIFVYVRTIIDIVFFVLSFYILPYSISEKQVGQKKAA
jgi:cbb3-type cytochrome oxidase subunit 1